MGCDIHCYVEKWVGTHWVPVYPPNDEGAGWRNWGRYTPSPSPIELLAQAHTPVEQLEPHEAPYWYFGRDYEAFGNLAGVRRQDLVFEEPRGLPEDMSPGTLRVYGVKIGEDLTSEKADRWVKERISKRFTLGGEEYVTGPGWHSASYFTLRELATHIAENLTAEPRILELREAMKNVLQENGMEDASHVRVVFWFDN